MTDLPALKACPFCGGSLEITKHFKEPLWRGLHRCQVVGAMTFDWNDDVGKIAAAWNRRAIPADAPRVWAVFGADGFQIGRPWRSPEAAAEASLAEPGRTIRQFALIPVEETP